MLRLVESARDFAHPENGNLDTGLLGILATMVGAGDEARARLAAILERPGISSWSTRRPWLPLRDDADGIDEVARGARAALLEAVGADPGAGAPAPASPRHEGDRRA